MGDSTHGLASLSRRTALAEKRHIHPPSRRKANALLFLTEKIGTEVLPYLTQNPDLNLKIVSDFDKDVLSRCLDDPRVLHRVECVNNSAGSSQKVTQTCGHRLARWADLLFVVADVQMTALMLQGCCCGVITYTLRCWDTSKRIVMLPEMMVYEWRHPLWTKQKRKLEKKWDWVHVLRPALYDYRHPHSGSWDTELEWDWEGPEEIIEAIQSEAENVIRSSQCDPLRPFPYPSSHSPNIPYPLAKPKPSLPAEIWTLVMDFLEDWELATALHIYTHTPIPHEWLAYLPRPGKPTTYTLEYTILTSPIPVALAALSHFPTKSLSSLATKLIFRFALTPILTYLASHHKEIFWTSFGLTLLPTKASTVYNSPRILDWWRTYPAVLKKEYGPEALDGASRAGFVDVLDWWLASGLRLSYTERALESASSKGHTAVLEWWKRAHFARAASTDPNVQPLPLKVGKSILAAAQSGRTASLAWWDASGIPYAHEDGVARLASTYGHVDVLALWKELKGSKMIFDASVLVGATKNGHAGVLEWWKRSGFSVEYKTCDIEEAMEDAVGGGTRGEEVREWWARNGLNLGVGTGEWMKVKIL